MPYLVGNRNDQVISKSGHTLRFKPQEKTFVPEIPELIKECTNRGHVVFEEKAPETPVPRQVSKPASKSE